MKLAARLAYILLGLAFSVAEPIQFSDNRFDHTCNYTAQGVPAKVFYNGTDRRYQLFPLEYQSYALLTVDQPWRACFGPGEIYDVEAIRQRKKLPCQYSISSNGTIEYWEEHACNVLLKANCYCYAIDRYVGSFCEPGYGNLNVTETPKDMACDWAVKGILADGAVKVDRYTVYNVTPAGHYIAMAIWPEEDFHFWRLDSDGAWANKPGMYMSRRTYMNRTKITDVEHPDARGPYTEFCGYFEVFPETHRLTGTGYYHSDIPRRFERWTTEANITTVSQAPLLYISPGWMHAYRKYWELYDTSADIATQRRPIDHLRMSSKPSWVASKPSWLAEYPKTFAG